MSVGAGVQSRDSTGIESRIPGTSRRGRVVAGLVVAVGLLWLLVSSGEASRAGEQIPTRADTALELAGRSGWQPLIPLDGELRTDFPEPMVWAHGRSLCIGFSRVDFGPDDRRPSLARCVPDTVAVDLLEHQITVVDSMQAGADTWHFIAVAEPVVDVVVDLAVGAPLERRRIYVVDSMIVLLLPNGVALDELRWSTDSGTFTCNPTSDAWWTSQFCAG